MNRVLEYLLIFTFFTIGLYFQSCKNTHSTFSDEHINWVDEFTQSVDLFTFVQVHDIFSPPVASRNYAYPLIASYEILRLKNENFYPSLIGQLNGLEKPTEYWDSNDAHLEYASVIAFLITARHFIFSEEKLDEQLEIQRQQFLQANPDRRMVRNSEELANRMSEYIISWANQDNYKQTRSSAKFTLDERPWTWKPTPPAYMEGIEPNWREIRTFFLDSATQFIPLRPTVFNMEKGSDFYKELIEVYDAVNQASEEQFEIAHFWDCNPYKMNVTGHVMHATKKITPGGHWISIAGLAGRKSGEDLVKVSASMAATAIAIADGFIACWDEKYRSILIRPETLINEYIDENWMPLLQTPPFPEYPSGHSVISTAAAKILTAFYGDNFSFDDDTEVPFGLPVRSFISFDQAAQEAAISRLYGGIHYMPAIEQGILQGKNVASYFLDKIDFGPFIYAD
jgi:hypothetical protein